MTLKTRNAIVTGSTSGIGLAIARAFAKQGANVTINGFGDADAIETERARIEKDFGVKSVYSPADLTKPDEIRAMVSEAEKAFGSVDILVNNAGIQHVDPIEKFPLGAWDKIIALNLSAAFHAIAAAIPGMKARKWGRIISTASAHSQGRLAVQIGLCLAKHGIDGLTKTAALELATFGVTVNCISPGYVWTPLVEKQIPDTMKARNLTREQVIHDVLLDGAADEGIRHRRSGGGAGRLPYVGCGEPDHRRQSLDRRRLDGRISGERPRMTNLKKVRSRAAGRRLARRVHLGRPRLSARGRPSRHCGGQRHQRRGDECRRPCSRLAGERP